MHILAGHYWSEFQATPQLFRIDHASGQHGNVPTLLLKASTLLLKYIVQGSPVELILARCGGRLLYGAKILDDVAKPATIWSIAEHAAERDALQELLQTRECPLFLFNELTLNAAWNTVHVDISSDAERWITEATLGPIDHSAIQGEAHRLLDRLPKSSTAEYGPLSASLNTAHEWRETINHYITNQGAASPVHLFNRDEGGQQEQLAIWMTDSLQPSGVVHSPQVPKGGGRRELTDLLLSYQYGTILIESKTLTIFNRRSLPSREALASDVSRHIDKAVAQLRGAIRALKRGLPVFDKSGTQLEVDRSQPMHAIVLVPDFDLIQDQNRYDKKYIADFMEATGGFLHFLDIAEMLRVVQAAQMISRRGTKTTPLMAFDYYLIERVKKTLEADSLVVEILLRMSDSEGHDSEDPANPAAGTSSAA